MGLVESKRPVVLIVEDEFLLRMDAADMTRINVQRTQQLQMVATSRRLGRYGENGQSFDDAGRQCERIARARHEMDRRVVGGWRRGGQVVDHGHHQQRG